MDELTDLVYNVVGYLNAVMSDITAGYGYFPASGERPLKEPKIFVSPTGRSGDRVSVRAAVYMPAQYGGIECSECAEEIFEQIHMPYFSPGIGRILAEAEIGEIKYDPRSAALVCAVKIVTEKRTVYRFTAENFSKGDIARISGSASDYKIERHFGVGRYFEVFNEMPIGVSDEENTYNIILSGVDIDPIGLNGVGAAKLPEHLGGSGEFRLTIGEDVFDRCLCTLIKHSGNGETVINIQGYSKQHDDIETDEIIEE